MKSRSSRCGSWQQSTLGEALPIKYGKARSAESGYPRPGTSIFGSNGAFDKFDRALTTGPTLIVGRKGAAGAVHYSEDPCWPIDTAFYVEGKEGRFLPFFRYLLESLQLGALDRSTAIPSLSRDDYCARIVHYPESEKEQRHVVGEIEKQFTRLDAGVVALRRVQANLKRYRSSVLKTACEGRLVPTEAELARAEGRFYEPADQLLDRILTERRQKWSGRGEYKEPVGPDTRKLMQAPEGWRWTSLDAAIVAGPQNGVYLPRKLYGKGEPILRIDDFQNGWIRNRENLKKVAADSQTASTYRLEEGDLVINRVNSMTHLGKCVVIRESLSGALFESNMMRCRLACDIEPYFIELYLRSRDGSARLIQAAKWAVNQASINQQDVRNTALLLPPLTEQKRIVAEVERRLSVVDQLDEILTANLHRTSRLRQAILQKAFTGNQTWRQEV